MLLLRLIVVARVEYFVASVGQVLQEERVLGREWQVKVRIVVDYFVAHLEQTVLVHVKARLCHALDRCHVVGNGPRRRRRLFELGIAAAAVAAADLGEQLLGVELLQLIRVVAHKVGDEQAELLLEGGNVALESLDQMLAVALLERGLGVESGERLEREADDARLVLAANGGERVVAVQAAHDEEVVHLGLSVEAREQVRREAGRELHAEVRGRVHALLVLRKDADPLARIVQPLDGATLRARLHCRLQLVVKFLMICFFFFMLHAFFTECKQL